MPSGTGVGMSWTLNQVQLCLSQLSVLWLHRGGTEGNPFFPLHFCSGGGGAGAERGQAGEDASVSDV